MALTPEDIWYFHHNGYIVAPGRLPDELMDRINAVTDREVAEQIEPIDWRVDARDPNRRIVNRLSKVLLRAPEYFEAASHPAVLDPLEGILGPHVELYTNKHNMMMIKPAGAPTVGWHRDEPVTALIVTMIVPLSDTNLHNGCLWVVPGSHVNPFEADPHVLDRARNRAIEYGPFEDDEYYPRALPVPMKRGQVLLFHGAIWHGSGVNHSEADRRSITFAYGAHERANVLKDDPEKILLRGERVYAGHRYPGPEWRWPRPNGAATSAQRTPAAV